MYFCITTDKNDMYDGFKYKTGLNENVPNNSKLHCNKYICSEIKPNDIYIRYVILLPDTKSFMNCRFDIKQNKYMLLYLTVSDKIYLSERYYLYDFRTIRKFNLVVSKKYLETCCLYGALNVLERLQQSEITLLNSADYILDNISEKGYINVLNWWVKSNLPVKYSEKALNLASSKGYIEVLEWWQKNCKEFKCSTYALLWGSHYGHINVLDWWFNSGISLTYSLKNVLFFATVGGHLNVLKWWLKTTLNIYLKTGYLNPELKFHETSFEYASEKGNSQIVEWWIQLKPSI